MTGTDPVPMLSVTVIENDGTTRYTYELRTSGGAVRGALEQEYWVEVNQSLVRDLCGKINKSLKGALQGGPGDLWAELAGYGQTLYDHLFRPMHGNDEPELVAQMRQSSSPLLVRTNEMQVPWELLHDGTDFLGLSHDLGQGSVVRGGAFLTGRDVGRIERALIVGDPLGDLAAARSEAEHVAEWLTARGTECTLLVGEDATLVDVVGRLSSTPYDLLHYCGHVSILNRPADSGLMLHQRRLLNETALRTAAKVGAPPVVFINGCRSAGPIANLCVSFMRMGAKVVVGTRAEVAEASARQFAEEFYLRLLDDQTAGSAVRDARLSLLNEPDGAWASFLLFGDPGVHITGGPLPPPTPKEQQGPYAPASLEMMRRVVAVAEPRGVAISMDLLFGLVTAPDLQDTLRRALGAERLTILTELMHTFVAETPGAAEAGVNGTPHPAMGGDVQLSDTVRSVLHQAEDNASAEGRSAITPHDIATAFAETGGGSAAQLLDAFGITPRQLFTPDLAAADPAQAPQAAPPSSSLPEKRPGTSAATGGAGGDTFNGDGRLRSGLLDERAAKAVGAALLLAAAKRSVIGSHTLLQGFALADSQVLRRALEAQGEAGRRAAHVLFSPSPRRRDFSRRSLGSIEQAQAERPGEPVGEAAILRGLLTDKEAAARGLLEQLGVDPDQLIRDLEPADRREDRPEDRPADQDRDPGSPG